MVRRYHYCLYGYDFLPPPQYWHGSSAISVAAVNTWRFSRKTNTRNSSPNYAFCPIKGKTVYTLRLCHVHYRAGLTDSGCSIDDSARSQQVTTLEKPFHTLLVSILRELRPIGDPGSSLAVVNDTLVRTSTLPIYVIFRLWRHYLWFTWVLFDNPTVFVWKKIYCSAQWRI